MELETPEFRAHLAAAVADTAEEFQSDFCRMSDNGWRYRAHDAPRPLYVLPTWGPQEDVNWRWCHQSLAILGVYVRLFLDHGDRRAVPMLESLIDDWSRNDDADPQFAWGEHSTALRLNRLVRLFGLLFDELSPGFRFRLYRLIGTHVERLLGGVIRKQHNHALDQIYALLLTSRYLPSLDIPLDELARRLSVERAHLLSAEGVVTENSPGYQSWIPARLAECQRLVTGEEDTALLAASDEFTAWIARPDGAWPEFGDTLPAKWVTPPPPPRSGFRVFPDAGYAVLRDERTWFAMKCGFLSHAHRHDDDGSFLLGIDGEDVFVEAGMFGYARGWEREYARSPQAHNISFRAGANTVRSTTSRRARRNRHHWGMAEVEDGVRCRSFMFDDAIYTRVATFHSGSIVLSDRFDVPGDIRTRFHVPVGVPIEMGRGRIQVGPVTLTHALPAPVLGQGYRTLRYLKYEPAQVIEFAWPAGLVEAAFEITY